MPLLSHCAGDADPRVFVCWLQQQALLDAVGRERCGRLIKGVSKHLERPSVRLSGRDWSSLGAFRSATVMAWLSVLDDWHTPAVCHIRLWCCCGVYSFTTFAVQSTSPHSFTSGSNPIYFTNPSLRRPASFWISFQRPAMGYDLLGSKVFLPRDAMLARYMLRFCVCHKSELYQIDWAYHHANTLHAALDIKVCSKVYGVIGFKVRGCISTKRFSAPRAKTIRWMRRHCRGARMVRGYGRTSPITMPNLVAGLGFCASPGTKKFDVFVFFCLFVNRHAFEWQRLYAQLRHDQRERSVDVQLCLELGH